MEGFDVPKLIPKMAALSEGLVRSELLCVRPRGVLNVGRYKT